MKRSKLSKIAILVAVLCSRSANADTLPMKTILNMGSHRIINVTDPLLPQDAATKAYADAAVGGAVGPAVAGQVAVFTAAAAIGGDAGLLYNSATNALTVSGKTEIDDYVSIGTSTQDRMLRIEHNANNALSQVGVFNSDSGTNAASAIVMISDTAELDLFATSSGYSSIDDYLRSDSAVLSSASAGGMSIAATGGTIRLYGGGKTAADMQMRISSSGIVAGVESALTGKWIFANSANSNFVTLQAGVTAAGATYTLPTAVPGGNAYAMVSTTGGAMSWSQRELPLTFTEPLTRSGDTIAITGDSSFGVTTINSGGHTYLGLTGYLTTKGDLMTYDTAHTRMGVGATGLPLVANSAATTGLNYAVLGVVGGGTGAATYTQDGVLYGNATSAIGATAQGGTRTMLTANGGPPSWSAAPILNTSMQLGVASSTTGALKLANSGSANLTTIQAGVAAAARTYTWPTNFGSATAVLTDTAGDGTLAWTVPTTGTVTGTGAANRTAYWSGTSALTSSATNTFNGTLMTLNQNAAALTAGFAGTLLQLSSADAAASRITIDAFAATGSLSFRRADNTAASKAALAAADESIGNIIWSGYGTTGYSAASRAAIVGNTSQVWTDANQGTYMIFQTTANNTTSVLERWRIDQAGNSVVFGSGSALATTATDGFLYLTNMAGAPTGDTTDYTGRSPIVWDSTNKKLMVNDGSTTWVQPIPGAALTKTDDTNVTATLGGAPTTALVNAASITLGWTGQLSVARGGTGAAALTFPAKSFSGQYTGQAVGATTDYFSDAGATLTAPLLTTAQSYPAQAGTYKNLRVNVLSNALATTMTCTLQKNGSDTSLVVSFLTTATGVASDTTHTVSYAAADTLDLKCTATNAGVAQAALSATVGYTP